MKRSSVVGAVVVLAVAAGVGFAAIPGATGSIDGCYDRRIGLLRLIDKAAGRQCLAFENPISWNAQGPPGEPGRDGDKGDSGEKGDPGDPGPSEARMRQQVGVDELPEPVVFLPGLNAFRTIVQVRLPLGAYVLMAKGTVLLDQAGVQSLGQCKLTFEGSRLDVLDWDITASTYQADVALLATVTVSEVPDDPFAPLPSAKVECGRSFGYSPATARSWRIVALKVGALS